MSQETDSQTQEELRSLNATLRMHSLTSTIMPILLALFIVTIVVFIWVSYSSRWGIDDLPHRDSAYDIVRQLRETPELAVLHVNIEKLAVYDSEHQNAQWRIADFLENKKAFCSIPVEISINFGYDLSELSARDITIDDAYPERKSIEIRLPKPRILDSGYSLKYHIGDAQKKPFCSSESGWIFKDYQNVSHGLKEAIRYQAYRDVLDENWLPIFGKEVQRSTELFFIGILRHLGYQNVIIVAG